MADQFRRRDVELLTAPREGPCVSVFLPTHRMGPDTEQDPVRLKNLLAEAEPRLVERGLRGPVARDLLAPAAALVHERQFWQHQSDGLALFLASGWWRPYRLPLEFPELTVVADRFHVKPILPLLVGDGRFFVLALSQNEIRLLEGTRQAVHEVDLEEVPRSLREALRFDDPQKERLFHMTGREGGTAAVFHGHGIGGEIDKERILRYLKLVDSGLVEILRDQQAPMVLAGVDYVRDMYRQVSRYPAVVEEGISGNPEQLRPEELHRRAWSVVEPLFRRGLQEATARYRELAGTGMASGNLEESVTAADQGRVDILFVPLGQQRWGTLHTATSRITVHEEPRSGDQDLLDLAAVWTILRGGTVYAIPLDRIPGGTGIAAILRY
ncbi:MAG: hypothetical protein ACRDIZ_02330 [Actinomycetota bacterium]